MNILLAQSFTFDQADKGNYGPETKTETGIAIGFFAFYIVLQSLIIILDANGYLSKLSTSNQAILKIFALCFAIIASVYTLTASSSVLCNNSQEIDTINTLGTILKSVNYKTGELHGAVQEIEELRETNKTLSDKVSGLDYASLTQQISEMQNIVKQTQDALVAVSADSTPQVTLNQVLNATQLNAQTIEYLKTAISELLAIIELQNTTITNLGGTPQSLAALDQILNSSTNSTTVTGE